MVRGQIVLTLPHKTTTCPTPAPIVHLQVCVLIHACVLTDVYSSTLASVLVHGLCGHTTPSTTCQWRDSDRTHPCQRKGNTVFPYLSRVLRCTTSLARPFKNFQVFRNSICAMGSHSSTIAWDRHRLFILQDETAVVHGILQYNRQQRRAHLVVPDCPGFLGRPASFWSPVHERCL